MALQPDKATILATVMGCILFGILTGIFVITAYMQACRRRIVQRLKWIVLLVLLLMYTTAFLYVVVSVVHALLGFIHYRTSPGTNAYLAITSNFVYIFKFSLFVTQTGIGDAFTVYRLWIFWRGKRILVIPALICLLSIVVTGVIGVVCTGQSSPAVSVFNMNEKHWIAVFYSLTLIMNATCTVLIAVRIRSIEKQTADILVGSHNLSPLTKVMVKSGTVYSIAVLGLLVSYICDSWIQYVMLDVIVQIIGIVYSLSIIRTDSGVMEGFGHSPAPSVAGKRQHKCLAKPLEVCISTSTHTIVHPPTSCKHIPSLNGN